MKPRADPIQIWRSNPYVDDVDDVDDNLMRDSQLRRLYSQQFLPGYFVMNYVIMLVISYLSMFIYLPYHVSCCP